MRTVVVGAVRGENGKSVSMIISAHEMVRRRLGCGVWAVGRIRRCLAEGGIIGVERSVDLIGRDVKKAEGCAIRFRKLRPIGSGFLKQAKGAVDVGADEIIGTMNGAVYVAFGGEMNDRARLFAPQQFEQIFAIDYVSLLETIARIGFDRTQIVEIARVGQLVEIDDARSSRGDPLQNKVGADKAGATGDENEIFHARKATLCQTTELRFSSQFQAGARSGIVRQGGGTLVTRRPLGEWIKRRKLDSADLPRLPRRGCLSNPAGRPRAEPIPSRWYTFFRSSARSRATNTGLGLGSRRKLRHAPETAC